MLELNDIRKEYDRKAVLDGISLKIERGQIISLLGPSGSGKTTLLNVILGLVSADSGSILYSGEDITSVPMKKRGFNIVFQDYALFPNLNALENITYSLRNRKEKPSDEETDALIDFLGLRPHLAKRVQELSGGQKQRVALARTLMTKPRVLLMDEPFSALDGVIKESIKERVKSIAREYSLTTIIVTHDPEEALTLSDKVLIIDNGKVAQFDTPRGIVKNPSSPFVRNFILGQLKVRQENLSSLFGRRNA
jgi:iron(III) transport system ATP-binding protein